LNASPFSLWNYRDEIRTVPITRILLVALSGDARKARQVLEAVAKDADVHVVTLGQLRSAGWHLLRGRYQKLAIAGSPPGDEIGYGLTPWIALTAGTTRILVVDLRKGHVRSATLARYLSETLPVGLLQLPMSALGVGVQRAIAHLAAGAVIEAGSRQELRSVLYLRPGVGAPSSVGGSVTHSHEVIRALRDAGIRVEAVTTDAAIAEAAQKDQDPPCSWRVAKIPRMLKALPASAGFGSDMALIYAASRSARRADVIYQRHARFSFAGALLARATGKPLFLEYNGSEEFVGRYWNPTPLKGQLAACERTALAGATRIFVVSEVDRKNLIARGIGPDRIIVNPNGVAVERFANGGRDVVRRRLGLRDRDLAIGFVGTFGPWHGADVLARAFSSIAPQLPDARLLLIGDGPKLEATRDLLKLGGVEDQAIFVGKIAQSEVPRYLDACDLLASPHTPLPDEAEFFGSPTKLFEYMASGKAIVASELGQIADVLEHGRTGWLVPPGDAEALASALRELGAAPRLREELGKRARREASDHTWQKNAGRILDAYRTVTGPAG
jgi:glycosyltransferase involved in cell wall biosynthesis